MRAATSLRDQRERRAGGIRQRSRHLFECRRQRRFDRFYTDPDEVVRVAYAANVGKLAAAAGHFHQLRWDRKYTEKVRPQQKAGFLTRNTALLLQSSAFFA